MDQPSGIIKRMAGWMKSGNIATTSQDLGNPSSSVRGVVISQMDENGWHGIEVDEGEVKAIIKLLIEDEQSLTKTASKLQNNGVVSMQGSVLQTYGKAINIKQQVRSLEYSGFPKFGNLATEIRLQIWHYSLPGGRHVCMDFRCNDRYENAPDNHICDFIDPIESRPPANHPSTLWVNRESRRETLKYYYVITPENLPNEDCICRFCISPPENFPQPIRGGCMRRPLIIDPSIDSVYISNSPHGSYHWLFTLRAHFPEILNSIQAVELRGFFQFNWHLEAFILHDIWTGNSDNEHPVWFPNLGTVVMTFDFAATEQCRRWRQSMLTPERIQQKHTIMIRQVNAWFKFKMENGLVDNIPKSIKLQLWEPLSAVSIGGPSERVRHTPIYPTFPSITTMSDDREEAYDDEDTVEEGGTLEEDGLKKNEETDELGDIEKDKVIDEDGDVEKCGESTKNPALMWQLEKVVAKGFWFGTSD